MQCSMAVMLHVVLCMNAVQTVTVCVRLFTARLFLGPRGARKVLRWAREA